MLRKQFNWHTHVFIVMYWRLVVEVSDVQAHELGTLSADDTIPKHIEIVRSAVSVVMSLNFLIKLPLAVIHTLFGSSFCGQKSTTVLAYVTTLFRFLLTISILILS